MGLLVSATARAALFRAYPVSDGADANSCTRQRPCRLPPAALAAVADGGEIWMLDSATYNAGWDRCRGCASGPLGSLFAPET